MQIRAMMRIRDEARWLREVLASIMPLTEDIVIFDDHSQDDSRKIGAEFGVTWIESPFPRDETNEVRDKDYLLRVVRENGLEPDYVICIDGDEVLERSAPRAIRARCEQGFGVASLPVRYIWNDREHYRVDGVYAKFTRASVFRLKGQPANVRFSSQSACNFHCGNVPANLRGAGATIPSAEILHLGYMHAEDRVRKFHWYNEKDPGNEYEDRYRHMILGDLPEYPATMKRVHGGPLKTYRMPQGKWPLPLTKEIIAQ